MTPTIGQRVQTTPAYHAELGRLFPLAKVPAFSVGTVRRIICRRAKDTVVDVAFDGYATFMLSTDWLTPTPKEGRTMTERTNADRAETGRLMMAAYAKSIGCAGDHDAEGNDRDALADLFHYMSQYHSDVGEVIEWALNHYDAEITETA